MGHRDQFGLLRAWGPASASYARENELDARKVAEMVIHSCVQKGNRNSAKSTWV